MQDLGADLRRAWTLPAGSGYCVLPTFSDSAANSASKSSMVRLWCIEQNFGPHIAQNSALLKYSPGSDSSGWAKSCATGDGYQCG